MPRSTVPVRPRHRSARTAAVVAALAALTLTVPAIAAHADDAPLAASAYSGVATLTGAPAGSSMLALLRYANGAWTWSNDGGQRAEINLSGPFDFGGLTAGTYGLGLLTLSEDYRPLTAELPDGTAVPVDEFAASLVEQGVSLTGTGPSAGVDLDGSEVVTDQSVSIPAPVTNSTLTGTVVDSDGATGQRGALVDLYVYDPASGVTEKALDSQERGLTATTGSGGKYTFTGLPAGYYVTHVSYAEDNAGFDPGHPTGVTAGGVWLDGATTMTAAKVTLPRTSAPPYVPPVVVEPSPSPSISASPSPSPSTSPTPSKTPLPSTPPAFEPVPITKVPSSLVLPAFPPIAVVPTTGYGAASLGLPQSVPKDQIAVNQALANEIGLAITQSGGQQSGPMISANVVSPPSLTPGLYVSVLDGLISVSNTGGSRVFAAGQFGFVPNFQTPPVILPSNPGLHFLPPPAFTQSVTTAISKATKPAGVDCEVRRVDTKDQGDTKNPGDTKDPGVRQSPPTPLPVKMYCNRIAVGRSSVAPSHHAGWHRHDTVTVQHGQRRVHMPLERLHGPGWYRIVTTYHLVLRFTALSTVHGRHLEHPVHVRRPAAIRSITYLHVTRP